MEVAQQVQVAPVTVAKDLKTSDLRAALGAGWSDFKAFPVYGLFFAATSATYGMPMVVELGIALDVLVGAIILGIFFFQIREQFDSLDLHHLEALRGD